MSACPSCDSLRDRLEAAEAKCEALRAANRSLERRVDWADRLRAEFNAYKTAVADKLHFRMRAVITGSPERHLLNLLARIHRDGGHYTEEHGLEKSVADADLKVAAAYAELGSSDPEEKMPP